MSFSLPAHRVYTAWLCPVKFLTFATCIDMPLIFEKTIDTAKKLAVWHITESEAEIFAKYAFVQRADYSKKRNLETAVSQILLNHLLGYDAHLNLTKDIYGKPYLDNTEIAVSFSHSKQMVACIIDMSGHAVGIDIEIIRESITSIAHKFQTPNDNAPLEKILSNHLVWGGKEVLYKIYAKKELDFIDHLSVNFDVQNIVKEPQIVGSGTGQIHKNLHQSIHALFFLTIGDFMMVWGY
jgi:4'-phosphopantetheinyl transferase